MMKDVLYSNSTEYKLRGTQLTFNNASLISFTDKSAPNTVMHGKLYIMKFKREKYIRHSLDNGS